MLHVLQSLNDGTTRVVDVPVPLATGPTLVVASRATVISAGTERMLVEFGRAGLIDKARQQPQRVRQLLDKVRTDGLGPTIEAVRAKLDAPIPLGYCQAGIVSDVGPLVTRFASGDRVVTNGPHAEFVRVTETLAARIPDGVSFEAAAFTPLAAIGLQGLRLAAPTVGETVVVYGLGLIGLLTVQLVRASGCGVIGIDTSGERLALAQRLGARTIAVENGVDPARAVLDLTDGGGADAVLLTLATDSNEPIHHAAAMSRQRGRIVLVGVAGLHLQRDDFYRKELSFQVSCSYGPGRYDPVHEEQGIDYPVGLVRWTEARNFTAVLDLMAAGRVDPSPLISHRIPIAEAGRAYDIVAGGEPSLGVVLTYDDVPEARRSRSVTLRGTSSSPGRATIGWIGSGNFASRVLIPAFAEAGATLEAIASSGGVSATVVGGRSGFRRATTDPASMLTDPSIDTIVITTRHDSHASWTTRALEAGRHVFVEKPLALTAEELERVATAAAGSDRQLCIGFNRRFAPLTRRAQEELARRSGPLALVALVNAGEIARDHWTQQRQVGGGRIVGEAVHFIDLARCLTGSPIRGLSVGTARRSGTPVDDVAIIELEHADGSISSIQYLAIGHRGFPKERLELFFDGKAIRIDNFRSMRGWGVSAPRRLLPSGQDKGHRALAAAFVRSVREGLASPIPREEVLEVSRWAIQAAELAARGGGTA